MPSQYIFDLAYIISTYFKSSNVRELLDMPIEQFMDLAVYCINSSNEQNNESYTDVKTITRPAPTSIRSGGWY